MYGEDAIERRAMHGLTSTRKRYIELESKTQRIGGPGSEVQIRVSRRELGTDQNGRSSSLERHLSEQVVRLVKFSQTVDKLAGGDYSQCIQVHSIAFDQCSYRLSNF